MNKEFSLTETAQILGINSQTLRRWDKSGRLKAHKKATGKISRYYYEENVIEDFVSADFSVLIKMARQWAGKQNPFAIPSRFYCPDRSIFKARLSRFEFALSQTAGLSQIFPLVVSIVGEIGNNSYDHNLGNWPDVIGAFFGYNIQDRQVVLADRGQGLLKTLKRVRPDLQNHSQVLRVAFTEFISGRAPEARGNGLKYVREVVNQHGFKLFFQTGDAQLNLGKRDKQLRVTNSADFIPGAFAIIHY